MISHAKYLGVVIYRNLNWCKMVTNKANNLAKCFTHVKCLYTTFVHPILDYASIIWSPYYQSRIYSIEMVQWRAAKFVINNYSNY